MSTHVKHTNKDGTSVVEKGAVEPGKEGGSLSNEFIESMVHLGYFDDTVLKKKESDASSIHSIPSNTKKKKSLFGINFKQPKGEADASVDKSTSLASAGKEQTKSIGSDFLGFINPNKFLQTLKEDGYTPGTTKLTPVSCEKKPKKKSAAWNERRKSSLMFDDRSLEKQLSIDSDTLYFMRIFRENDTFVTVPCNFDDQAKDLCLLLSKKLKIPENEDYGIYVSKLGKGERILYPFEKPVKILVRLLTSIGYQTDELKHVVREDNSYICCFSFKEVVSHSNEMGFDEIPNELQFESVNLRGQNLERPPQTLYQVAAQIRTLDLSQNLLLDFPLEFAQESTSLARLKLCRNEYQLIPSSLSRIKSLRVLDLSNNFITSLTTGRLQLLGDLDQLILCNNQISTIPEDYAILAHLTVLDLSNNNLDSFPSPICNMLQLSHLDVSFNTIDAIPSLFGELKKLKRFLVANNYLKGNLPECFGKLTELVLLDIRRNFLDDINVLSSLPKLEDLRCDQNQLSSIRFSNQRITQLMVSKNPIVEFKKADLQELIALDLDCCELSHLSETIFVGMPKLISLKLNNNHLTSIPKDSLNKLTHLEVFQCANNLLESLPDDLFLLPRLTQVDVHNNRLKKLPASIWQAEALYFFNASSNSLSTFPAPTAGSSGIHTPLKPGQCALPLALKLRHLILADNRLTEDVFAPISFLTQLNVLNLSCNDVYEVPSGGFFNLVNITELYFSGNQIANFPAEEVERLRHLKVFYLNANKLPSLPAELRKLLKLVVLDVANNQLNYNLSNWTYDWNWNCNRELRYLNLSGNKRLKIMNAGITTLQAKESPLSDFDELPHLRVLGLIDIDVMNMKLEQTQKRRGRTYQSIINSMGFGLSDRLDRTETLLSFDFVVPSFRESPHETLFGIFDIVPSHQGNREFGKYLSDWTAFHLASELRKFEKLEPDSEPGSDFTPRALRCAFLNLQREAVTYYGFEHLEATSAILAYRKRTTLYLAHIGDALGVVVRDGVAKFVTNPHCPASSKYDAAGIDEILRVRQDGGYITRVGRVNSEAHLSRCFGLFHQLPAINANPSVATIDLTEDDEMVILASRGLWDVMSYQTAADIARSEPSNSMLAAQKLRDLAIAYGAEGSIMVMVLSVGDLFNKKLLNERCNKNSYQTTDDRKLAQTLKKKNRNQTDLAVTVEPPVGKIVIVFTGIKNTTFLWENYPDEMASASRLHDNVLRSALKEVEGYEVKNEGDTFMASFSSVTSAILWCSRVQLHLLQVEWPPAILELPDCREIVDSQNNQQVLYRGLSVRMGMNYGEPLCERDPMTGRMDYFGPMVNKSARVSGEAKYGEICISSDVLSELMSINGVFDFQTEPEPVAVCTESEAKTSREVYELRQLGLRLVDIGEKKLKGVELPEPLVVLFPKSISGRNVPARHQLASKARSRVSLAPVPNDQVQTQIKLAKNLGIVCLRIEDAVHSLLSNVPGPDLVFLEQQMKSSIDETMSKRDIAKTIEVLSCRIENASATLSLIQMGSSHGSVLDSIHNYLLDQTGKPSKS